jgi:outer membrane protein insertion porin family
MDENRSAGPLFRGTSAAVTLCVVLFAAHRASAQTSQDLPIQPTSEFPAGQVVVDVRVAGNESVLPEHVRRYIHTRVDRPLDRDVVLGDVRRMAKSRLFEDVKAYYRQEPAGMVVIFYVTERPRIKYLRYVGNDKVKDKVLDEHTGLKRGAPIDTYAVEEGRRKMEDFYRQKGHSKVRITIAEGSKPTDDGVVYIIREGPRQRVKWTKFEGNTIVNDARLRTQIESKPPILWIFKGFLNQRNVEADVERLTSYYHNLGYFQVNVSRIVNMNDDLDWATITYVISEGQRFTVNNISFIGNQKFPTETLAADLELNSGEFFDRVALQGDQTRLQDLYGGHGYVFADIEPDVRFLEEPGKVDLIYNVDEGHRYHVGRVFVHIGGEDPHTRITTVLNRMSIHPGDIVDVRELRDSERRLQRSGLFMHNPQLGQTPKIVFSPPNEETERAIARRGGGNMRGQSPDSTPHVARYGPNGSLATPPVAEVRRLPPVGEHVVDIYVGDNWSTPEVVSRGVANTAQWVQVAGPDTDAAGAGTSEMVPSGTASGEAYNANSRSTQPTQLEAAPLESQQSRQSARPIIRGQGTSLGSRLTPSLSLDRFRGTPNYQTPPANPSGYQQPSYATGNPSSASGYPSATYPPAGNPAPPGSVSYPPSGATSGYATQPGSTTTGGYPPSGSNPAAAYGPTSPRNSTGVPAYTTNPAYTNQPGYVPGPSYTQPPGGTAQPGSANQPGYTTTPGYVNQPPYNAPGGAGVPAYTTSPVPSPTYPPSAGSPHGGQPGAAPGYVAPAPAYGDPNAGLVGPNGEYIPPGTPGIADPNYGRPGYTGPPSIYPPEGIMSPDASGWDEPSRPLDLNVTAQEAQTGRLMFGVGVNSDLGVVGSIILDEQNFDITRLPTSWSDVINGTAFRGRGQQLRIEAVPGTQVQRYMINFRDPYLMDTPISFGLSGFFFDRRYEDWDEQRLGGRISLGYQLSPDLAVTSSIRAENVNVHDPAVPTPDQLTEVLGDNALYGAQIQLTHDTRDSAFLPTEGHLFRMSFEQVFGDFDYPRAEVELSQYFLLRQRPDGSGRHVLSVSTELDVTGNQTPIYDTYYAGGFSTMRGFDFRGVSPRVGNVEVGGEMRWLNSIEYLFPLTASDALRGIVFVDYGTVEESFKIDADDFRVAPGFGLRVSVPALGPAPIALDLAFPVAHEDGDDIQNFSFFVGLFR